MDTYNKWELLADGATIAVYVNDGMHFLIDAVDLAKIAPFKWYARLTKSGWKISASPYKRGRARTTIQLSRLLLGVSPGEVVDHANHNPFDNRRKNIRVASSSQNSANAKLRVDSTTGYKGVTICGNKYKAEIRVNRKGIYLGLFERIEDAARAYNEAARRYFGEYAYLNKVEEA